MWTAAPDRQARLHPAIRSTPKSCKSVSKEASLIKLFDFRSWPAGRRLKRPPLSPAQARKALQEARPARTLAARLQFRHPIRASSPRLRLAIQARSVCSCLRCSAGQHNGRGGSRQALAWSCRPSTRPTAIAQASSLARQGRPACEHRDACQTMKEGFCSCQASASILRATQPGERWRIKANLMLTVVDQQTQVRTRKVFLKGLQSIPTLGRCSLSGPLRPAASHDLFHQIQK